MKKTSDKKNKIIRIILTVLIILTVSFIWSNSMQSKAESSGRSNLIVAFIKPLIDPRGKFTQEQFSFFVRKTAHFSEFALLGAELTLWLRLMRIRTVFTAPIAVLAVASIDETIQRFFGRAPMLSDVIIDFCGGLFGILVAILFIQFICFIQKKRKRIDIQ